jgi:hypothetical protein
MFDHGNYDFDHRDREEEGYFKGYKNHPKAYSKLRGGTASTMWAKDRKQHRSQALRRAALRACNKHVRNILKEEMKSELLDIDEILTEINNMKGDME